MITGNETISVIDCAVLIVNNKNEPIYALLAALGGLVFLYILWIYYMYHHGQMRKYMKKKGLYDDYLLYREHKED